MKPIKKIGVLIILELSFLALWLIFWRYCKKIKSVLQFQRLDLPCSYQQFHSNFTSGLSFAFQARDTPHPIPKLNPSLFCSACEQNFGQPMINTAND